MIVIGYILLFVGLSVAVAGQVMFLRVAYHRGLGWFLGCLFVPLFALLFLCLNLRQTAMPFVIGLTGVLTFLAGLSLAELDFYL
jgi:FtsH-binding integral membrane protein